MSLIRHKSITAFQTQFHRCHHHLHDPHVRALAWLLTAPNLLDPLAARWHGAIAVLDLSGDKACAAWLRALDADPAALHAIVNERPTARLGRYAEKLLGFYLQQNDLLFATNIQIRAGANATIGEFDYLLHDPSGDGLIHWEFATKFYLLESQRTTGARAPGTFVQADCFVGPNLADTLGAKMNKIMDRQLRLSHHPAAQAYLPLPVLQARALVKGWLFYADPAAALSPVMGVSADHCRGFWCTAEALAADVAYGECTYAILPRLQWLAPTRMPMAQTLSPDQLLLALSASFAADSAPVLIAVMSRHDGDGNIECDGGGDGDGEAIALEISRGFIVPEDWRRLAAERVLIDVQ